MKHVLRTRFSSLGLVLVLGWTTPRVHAEIYECKDPRGNVVYQDDPCTQESTRRVAPRRGGTTSARSPGDDTPVGTKPLTEAGCDPAPKGSGERSAEALARCQERRRRAVSRVEGSAAYRATIADTNAPPAVETPPRDPRLLSPERTWQTYLAAMRKGDRALALACLTSSALTKSGPDIESLPLEKLREIVEVYTGLEMKGDVGPFRAARASRTNGRLKWIFFERTGDGAWKIAAI